MLVCDGGWKPVTSPIEGRYDEYGALEDVDEDDALAAATIGALVTRLEFTEGPGRRTERRALRRAERRLRALDARVYRAIVSSSAGQANHAPATDMVVHSGLDDSLRPILDRRLSELTRFLSVAGELEPFDLDLCTQFEREAVTERAERAKQNWSTHPEVVAAIDENLAEWRELWAMDGNE